MIRLYYQFGKEEYTIMQQSDEMRKKEIENRVYMARKNAHLSQMKLAEMAEMSNNSISNIT